MPDVFVKLVGKPTNVTSDHIEMLKSFVLQLYKFRHDTISAARLGKFKKSTDNNLHLSPPSKEALSQHIYCASYQAWYLWRQSVEEVDNGAMELESRLQGRFLTLMDD